MLRGLILTNTSIGLLCSGLTLLALAGAARAENDRVKACLDLVSTLEQRECAHDLFRSASAELDEVYRRAIDQAASIEQTVPSRSEPVTLSRPEAIMASEKAWEAYRDAECWGVVGRPGGSGRLVWAYGCLAEKTLERIEEIKVPFDQR